MRNRQPVCSAALLHGSTALGTAQTLRVSEPIWTGVSASVYVLNTLRYQLCSIQQLVVPAARSPDALSSDMCRVETMLFPCKISPFSSVFFFPYLLFSFLTQWWWLLRAQYSITSHSALRLL